MGPQDSVALRQGEETPIEAQMFSWYRLLHSSSWTPRKDWSIYITHWALFEANGSPPHESDSTQVYETAISQDIGVLWKLLWEKISSVWYTGCNRGALKTIVLGLMDETITYYRLEIKFLAVYPLPPKVKLCGGAAWERDTDLYSWWSGRAFLPHLPDLSIDSDLPPFPRTDSWFKHSHWSHECHSIGCDSVILSWPALPWWSHGLDHGREGSRQGESWRREREGKGEGGEEKNSF